MEQTIILDIRTRHKEAHKELLKIANPVINKYGIVKSAGIVARRLLVSDQTVINYIYGRCKDGFLTEAIMHEYQNF